MISSLQIRNFRLFDEFELPELGLVNLFVGKNNSGKSSVLEAVRIWAEQGIPSTLTTILNSHDENLRLDNPLAGYDDLVFSDSFRHFFPKRQFPSCEGKEIYIGDKNRQFFVEISHRLVVKQVEEVTDEDGDPIRRVRRIPLNWGESYPDYDSNDISQALHITTQNKAFWVELADPEARQRTFYSPPRRSTVPCVYVPTDFVSSNRLAAMWDGVALTAGQEYPLQALRIIEPKVSGLAFIRRNPEVSVRQDDRIGIVSIEGHASPIPLASMGDGMTRVLQLVLSLFAARGGVLLLDEFENGLHYSVHLQVWKLLLRLAKELNVQVFATTHSQDCVQAFSQASLEDTEAKGFLYRLARHLVSHQVVATLFSEEKLERFLDSSLEVR